MGYQDLLQKHDDLNLNPSISVKELGVAVYIPVC